LGTLPIGPQLQPTLRERMRSSPLMDAKGFTQGLEAAYRKMGRRAESQASCELFPMTPQEMFIKAVKLQQAGNPAKRSASIAKCWRPRRRIRRSCTCSAWRLAEWARRRRAEADRESHRSRAGVAEFYEPTSGTGVAKKK